MSRSSRCTPARRAAGEEAVRPDRLGTTSVRCPATRARSPASAVRLTATTSNGVPGSAVGHDEVRDAEPRRDRSAVAVVPVEELERLPPARRAPAPARAPRASRPGRRARPARRPRARATSGRRLVDDPREPVADRGRRRSGTSRRSSVRRGRVCGHSRLPVRRRAARPRPGSVRRIVATVPPTRPQGHPGVPGVTLSRDPVTGRVPSSCRLRCSDGGRPVPGGAPRSPGLRLPPSARRRSLRRRPRSSRYRDGGTASSASRASGSVNRPARSALPATAPRSRARGGRGGRRARRRLLRRSRGARRGGYSSSSSRSGPASEPSRRVLVTSRRGTPAAAQRRASSAGVDLGRRASSPRPRPSPSRTSTATTSALAEPLRPPPRGTPARARPCRPSRGRRRPRAPPRSRRACGSRRRPGAAGRPPPATRSTSASEGVPAKAPSRSTRWRRRGALGGEAPCELDGVAALDRDRLPASLARRTARPSRTSIAGITLEVAC